MLTQFVNPNRNPVIVAHCLFVPFAGGNNDLENTVCAENKPQRLNTLDIFIYKITCRTDKVKFTIKSLGCSSYSDTHWLFGLGVIYFLERFCKIFETKLSRISVHHFNDVFSVTFRVNFASTNKIFIF